MELGGTTTVNLHLVSKVFEIAVDPASSGRPLKAGRAGGGKPPRVAQSTLCLRETNEAAETTQGGIRCGITAVRHLACKLKRTVNVPPRRERKTARDAREGETVSGFAHCQMAECVHDILANIAAHILPSLGVQGVPTNVVAKCLHLVNDEGLPTSGEGLRDPSVKVPSHQSVIPARQDKTTPTGCPDLLERGHSPPAVQASARRFARDRGLLLGKALNK
jgi:hypothetical protein